MIKPVKGTDQRKKKIVAALKAKSGGNQVTSVKDFGDGTFEGNCMLRAHRLGAQILGRFIVTKEEAGL
jgi:hypothetical protein